jgi:plastocyanin
VTKDRKVTAITPITALTTTLETAMLNRNIRIPLAALASALLAAGCGSNDGGGVTAPIPPANSVAATPSLAFTPGTLTIHAGDEVTFAFGSVAHNVFFDPKSGVPGDIQGSNANVSVARTFTTAGTYTYICHIHPSMHGTVVVQ